MKRTRQVLLSGLGSLSCLSISTSCLVFLLIDVKLTSSQPSGVTSDRPIFPSTTAPNRSILKPGSRGSEVTELQATLKLLGYYDGAVDGVYGQDTIAAVSQFQQIAGLNADGIVGPATWNRLFPSTPELPVTESPAVVSRPANSQIPATTSSGFPIPSTATPESPVRPTSPPIDRPASSTPSTPASKPNTPTTQPPQSAADPVSLPTLKLGAKGPAVVGLQERLRAVGVFKGVADGVFGAETQAAVRAAQRKFSLSPDGVVGPATWTALLR